MNTAVPFRGKGMNKYAPQNLQFPDWWGLRDVLSQKNSHSYAPSGGNVWLLVEFNSHWSCCWIWYAFFPFFLPSIYCPSFLFSINTFSIKVMHVWSFKEAPLFYAQNYPNEEHFEAGILFLIFSILSMNLEA